MKSKSATNLARIAVFQRVIPAYRVPVFRVLVRRYNATIVYSEEKKGVTLKSVSKSIDDLNFERVSRVYFGNKTTFVFQNIFRLLNSIRPNIVITEFGLAYISMWCLLFLRKCFGFKIIIWTHGINNGSILKPYSGLKGKLTLAIFKRANCLLFYSEKRKDATLKIRPNLKIFVAPNTLDLRENHKNYKSFSETSLKTLKEELGWVNKYNLVYIGRLDPDKNIELLIEIVIELQKQVDIGLHIIGSGFEERHLNAGLKSIYLYSTLHHGIRKSQILYASDLCINPGYVGLSILDAFAHGTPLCTLKTTDSGPFHGPEFEYLENEINGIIAEDQNDLVRKCIQLLRDRDKLREMQSQAYISTLGLSLDKMLSGFDKAVNYVSNCLGN